MTTVSHYLVVLGTREQEKISSSAAIEPIDDSEKSIINNSNSVYYSNNISRNVNCSTLNLNWIENYYHYPNYNDQLVTLIFPSFTTTSLSLSDSYSIHEPFETVVPNTASYDNNDFQGLGIFQWRHDEPLENYPYIYSMQSIVSNFK